MRSELQLSHFPLLSTCPTSLYLKRRHAHFTLSCLSLPLLVEKTHTVSAKVTLAVLSPCPQHVRLYEQELESRKHQGC